jgi:hypothetical protein
MRETPLLALVALALLAPATAAAKPHDLLPDLAQGIPTDISIVVDTSGAQPQSRLAFHSSVVNVGEGPLVLTGRRSASSPTMTAHQVVRRSNGSSYVRPQSAGVLRYVKASDHQHWHLLGFDRYELWNRDATRRLLRDRKQGFCLGDRFSLYSNRRIPHQPRTPAYTTYCGKNRPDLRHIVEGITVGWGDDYRANIEGQYIDVSGVAAGRYLLVHRVNAGRGLREINRFNNVTCAPIELKAPAAAGGPPTVTVLADRKPCDKTYDRWGVPGG